MQAPVYIILFTFPLLKVYFKNEQGKWDSKSIQGGSIGNCVSHFVVYPRYDCFLLFFSVTLDRAVFNGHWPFHSGNLNVTPKVDWPCMLPGNLAALGPIY